MIVCMAVSSAVLFSDPLRRRLHCHGQRLLRALLLCLTAMAEPWGISGVAVAEAIVAPRLSPEDLDFFESKVRPILVEHCSECHTRKTGEPEAGLSFDSRGDFLAAEGVAVAGKPDQSLIVQVIGYDGEIQMPPDGKLPPEAILTVKEWVQRGLPWPDDGTSAGGKAAFDIGKRKADHWCWHAPKASSLPSVQQQQWCRSDLDHFILARLESAQLSPAPPASLAVLVRRASEIITGLPASPDELDRVTNDPDPLAYEKYIDTLLASPHYGERFARHWLDVVRYAETRGHEFDHPIPNAWRYRDWVIKALNDDIPYDQFVREQIAGDLCEHPRVDAKTGANESVVGTGFWFLGEEIHSPVDIAQDEADRIDNRVDTFGKAFLGLALGCARCHDHKFDAISNEDYYAIAGMLMSSNYRQVPYESLETNRAVAKKLAALDLEARQTILPLLAAWMESVTGTEGIDGIKQGFPSLVEIEKTASQLGSVDANALAQETPIANYTSGLECTPIIADASAWGLAPLSAGQPSLSGGGQAAVVLQTFAVAQSDAFWSASKTSGERDPGPVGEVDRSGRMLRTPKVRLNQGTLWYRVRGHFQIVAEIDSHRFLPGPLHGRTIISADTKGQWQWIRHDLQTYAGHRVQIEFTPKGGEAAVAEVVESIAQPVRIDPLLRVLAQRVQEMHTTSKEANAIVKPDPQEVSQAIHDAGQQLFTEALKSCRDGTLSGSPRAGAMATLINLTAANALAKGPSDAQTATFEKITAEVSRLSSLRNEISAAAKLESATAPAILDGNGVDQHVLFKGTAARPGELSPRRFLEAIDGAEQPAWPTQSSGRRELADRVLDPENPLASRVAVNRIWHHLFGRGLVATTDNFGKLGEQPSDPHSQALLDTLAVRFRDEGWGVKRLIKEIVTSSTWRMSSRRDPQAVVKDPLNLLLHHYPLRRLEGEAVHDKIMAVSGRLDRTIGGPGVEVFLSDFQQGRGRPGSGPLDLNGRRSVYVKIRRNFLPSFLLAFDMPNPFQAMGRRTVTNVPAQALVLMNDPFVMEQSRVWAKKTLADEKMTPSDRVHQMYREAFSRPPEEAETSAAIEFLTQQAQQYGVAFQSQPRNEAVWADFAHTLYNAKEFIFIP